MPAARSWRAPRTRISTGVSRRLELWTARRDGGEGADLFLDPAAFREAFAADVDQATADVMAAAQRPYAAAAFAAAPSGPPAWKTLPCWYLLGTEDKAIPPALQRFMAERANATIVEVPASHVSFVSARRRDRAHPSRR
jgi:pimeloyl-ACP methyl ester carboxylesterase